MNDLIELEGLGVRLAGRPILRDLRGSLSGRAVGLLGPNGAGKTTLLHTLLGFFPVSEGTARVFGKDVRTDSKAIRALAGYMPENESYVPGMTAVRFVRLMAELSGLPPEAALERAHEALFYVGLGEARYRLMETFSLGMKQRVKLAQAVAHAPRLVILDEPTNGLDPPARQRMIRLIQEIVHSGEIRLILSSHLLRDVEECCDSVLVLKDGRVAANCNLEEQRRANKRFLELEVYGDDGSFAEAVAALGCECASQGNGRLKMVLPDAVQIRDLYRVASERRARIRRLNYKRDSLQDIFLKAMEGDTRGGV
jgi:ABC-2 type transport system ATP-binding protein